MSAPRQGRNSPEPERQAESQTGKTAEPNKQGAADSLESGKQESDKQKTDVLSSNPKGPLEDAAEQKTAKGHQSA